MPALPAQPLEEAGTSAPVAAIEAPPPLPTTPLVSAPAESPPVLPMIAGLSRRALASRLRTLLGGCTPGFITETIKVRATPGDAGTTARLELTHPAGLRRQDVECVRAALKGASLKIASTEAMTVDVELAAK